MPTPVPKTAGLADRASRRALVRDGLHLSGRGLAVGAGAGLILIGADRVAGDLLPWSAAASGLTLWPYLLGVPAAVGAASGLAIAVVRRWRADRAALEIDRALGLKERLSSALAMASGPLPAAGFEGLAIRDAETTAPNVNLRRALPIRLEWTWVAWPALAAGAAAIALLVPQVQWRTPTPSEAEEVAQTKQAAADVRDAAQAAKDAVQRTLADRAVVDVASTEQLKQLESLEKELLSSKTGAGEARVKAADSLEKLADQLQSKAREDQAAQDALREQLAQTEAPAEGATTPLAEALRDGDMGAAQKAAQDLMGKMDGMSEAERRALAQDLEQLAEKLKPQPEADSDPPQGTNETSSTPTASSESSLAPAGGPESGPAPSPKPEDSGRKPPAETPADQTKETDPEKVRERLEKQGVPPDQSGRLAEEVARKNREQEARDQAKRDAEQLRENLREAARQARENQPKQEQSEPSQGKEGGEKDSGNPDQKSGGQSSKPSESGDRQGQQTQSGDKNKPGDQGMRSDDGKVGDQSKAGDQNKTGDEGKEGRQPGAGKKPGDQPDPNGDKAAPGEGDKPGSQKPETGQPGVKSPASPTGTPSSDGEKTGQEQGDQPGAKQGDKAGDQPGDKPGNQPGDQPGAKPGEKPGDKPGNQPGEESGEQAGDKPGDEPGDEPGEKPGDQSSGGETSDPSGKHDPNAKPGGVGEGTPTPGQGDGSGQPKPGNGGQPGAKPEAPTGEQPGDSQKSGSGPEGTNPPPQTSPDTDGPAAPAGTGGSDGHGFKKLQEQLDGLAERQRNAKQAPRISRDLRDRAQRLLNEASDEDRKAMERWAEQAAKERTAEPADAGPGPASAEPWAGQTDVVDGRDHDAATPETAKPDPSEHVIAEWFTDQGIDRSGAASKQEMSDQIQQASKGAEEAIEQQNVPRRHSELIRRIFGRYTQRAKGQTPPPPPADAPDAEPAKGSGK